VQEEAQALRQGRMAVDRGVPREALAQERPAEDAGLRKQGGEELGAAVEPHYVRRASAKAHVQGG
jgi:hypothetical protein